jgi:hypothetical protein
VDSGGLPGIISKVPPSFICYDSINTENGFYMLNGVHEGLVS